MRSKGSGEGEHAAGARASAGHARIKREALTWASIIEERRSSGQSVRVFCRDRGIVQGTFYGWQRRLRERDCRSEAAAQGKAAEPKFLPVPLTRQPRGANVPATTNSIEVEIDGAMRIKLAGAAACRVMEAVLARIDRVARP